MGTVIDPEALQEFQKYIDLCETIEHMSESNMSVNSIKVICDSEYIYTEEGIYLIARLIFNAIPRKSLRKIWRKLIDSIIDYGSKNCGENKLNTLEAELLKYIFRPNDSYIFPRTVAEFNTMWNVLDGGQIEWDVIKPYVQNFIKTQQRKSNLIIVAYIFFGPYLEESERQNLAKLIEAQKNDSKLDPELYKKYIELKDFPPTLRQYLEHGVLDDSVQRLIQKDDLENLIKYSTVPEFDPSMTISGNVLEPYYFLQHHPSLLQYAAYFGSVRVFKWLLIQHADIKYIDGWRHSTQDFAVSGGNNEIIKIIQNAGYSFADSIQTAAKQGNVELFDWIINTQSSKQKPEALYTRTLCFCASSNNPKLLLFCLRQPNVLVNSRDGDGFTPLISSVFGRYMPILRFLVRIGADVNFTDGGGETALHAAAKRGFLEVMEFLLNRPGIDANVVATTGRTPLLEAVFANQVGAIELLLSHRPPVDITAGTHRAGDLAVLHENLEALRCLLGHPDVFNPNSFFMNFRMSPLVHFAEKGRREFVELMFEFPHVDRNFREGFFGHNALQAAVRAGQVEMTEFLLGVPGIDAVTKNKFGRDLLYLAKQAGPAMLKVVRDYFDADPLPSSEDSD